MISLLSIESRENFDWHEHLDYADHQALETIAKNARALPYKVILADNVLNYARAVMRERLKLADGDLSSSEVKMALWTHDFQLATMWCYLQELHARNAYREITVISQLLVDEFGIIAGIE